MVMVGFDGLVWLVVCLGLGEASEEKVEYDCGRSFDQERHWWREVVCIMGMAGSLWLLGRREILGELPRMLTML